jgi:hypothetical protein
MASTQSLECKVGAMSGTISVERISLVVISCGKSGNQAANHNSNKKKRLGPIEETPSQAFNCNFHTDFMKV